MTQYASIAKRALAYLTLQKSEDELESTQQVIAQQSIPLIALGLGLFYYVSAEIIIYICGGPSINAGILSALIITLFDAYLYRGQKLAALSWTGELLQAWQNENYEEAEISKHYSLMLLNLGIIIKLTCIAVIVFKGQSIWLSLAPIFAATVFSLSAPKAELAHPEASFSALYAWGIAALCSIPCILIAKALPQTILALLIVAGATHFLSLSVLKAFGTINRQLCLALTEVTFILTLLCTLVLIL